MQVSIESTGNLSRRMTVELPPEKIGQEVERRLSAMTRTVRLKGFRPGKAPLKVVKQQFESRVLQEVLSDFMRSSYQDAIAQQKLRPAGGPSIKPENMSQNQGLKYVAEFEIMPEFELANLQDVQISRPAATVLESDVDTMMESLQKQRAIWKVASRPAQTGDRIVIDYEGTVGGEVFENNKATGFTVEIGAKRWLEEFENQLIGLSTGDEKALEVQYPEAGQPSQLAGKMVRFDVKVQSVLEADLPALNDEFAAQFGITDRGLAGLRDEVRANMERELRQRAAAVLRDRVMKALQDVHQIEVPAVMVREEVARLKWSTEQAAGQQALSAIPDQTIETEARRRAALGLIVGEIIRRHAIKLDGKRLMENIEAVAMSYEEPARVIEYYRTNASARTSMETLTLEQQVVDWVMTQSKVTDEQSSFAQLVQGRPA